MTASTPATFAVSFPAPEPPVPLSSLATTVASTSTTVSGVLSAPAVRAASDRNGSSSGDIWLVVGAAAGGAAVVVLAGVFVSRRTKLVEPRPVEPKQLLAGPSPPVDAAVRLPLRSGRWGCCRGCAWGSSVRSRCKDGENTSCHRQCAQKLLDAAQG